MKKFFQSEWFKCITTLLVLAVLFSGILAILSDVLYVTPKERTMRAIKKIYGTEKEFTTVIDIDVEEFNKTVTYEGIGSVNKLYEVDKTEGASNYDLLFQTTGFNGYKGGTITLWTQVKYNNNKYEIVKVLLESFDKQTLMSKLSGDYYGKFKIEDITDAYNNGKFFTPSNSNGNNLVSNPVSGASYSATAGNNAVNCVIKYVGEMNGTPVVTPDMKIKDAIKNIYGEDKTYVTVIDNEQNIGEISSNKFGTVNKVIEIGDKASGNYDILYNSTGIGGLNNGTVTLWIRVNYHDNVYDIVSVKLDSADKQSYINKLDENFYNKFKVNNITSLTDGQQFTTNNPAPDFSNPVTGATLSATAGNNAVNCVIYYLGGLQ